MTSKPKYPALVTDREKIARKIFIQKRRSALEQKWLNEQGGKPIVVNRECKN